MEATAATEMTRYDRWRAFHDANPRVYELFKRFAVDALRMQRRKRYGAHAIFERLRWHVDFETTDCDYKLNDHYAPYYARLLTIEEPEDFGEFFELRHARSDVTLEQMKADFFGNGHFEQRELFDE